MRATDRRRLTRIVCAGILMLAALTTVASTPASAAGATCTYNGTTDPITGVTAGATTIAVACTGLAADEVVVVNLESPLAEIVQPATAAPNEAAIGSAVLATADGAGTLAATFAVPATFAAADPAAACPPTQAQVNAGLGTCALAVRDIAGSLAAAPGRLVYSGQPMPNIVPTLTVTNGSSFVPGNTVALMGSGYWGSSGGSTPTVTFGALAAEVSPVSPARIAGPTYTCGPDECATNAGTLSPGLLLGNVVVPAVAGDTTATITAQQANTSPFPGNGPGGTVAASALVSILGGAVAYASPGHGGVGMPVSVTGTGWDPQGDAPEISILTPAAGETASTASGTVDANGNLSGVLTIGTGDATGANPILVTQLSSGGIRTAQALFTVDTSGSCTADGCTSSQVLSQSIITGGLSMSELTGTVSLSPVTLNGAAQESSGALGTVTILDGRGTFDGWQVTATMAGDFVSDAGTGPNYTIAAASLRWEPRVGLAAPGSGIADEVIAGPSASLSTTTGATLCSAPLGGGGGAFTCDADLFLEVPASVARGTYTATLNITIT